MIDYLLSADNTFNNISILIDIDSIITKNDSAENSPGTAFFADNSIELRLLFEAHLRDRINDVLVIYHGNDTDLPYDIEKKCPYRCVTLASLFPLLDKGMIRGLSPNTYRVLLEKTRHLNADSSPALSADKTAAFVMQALYGIDLSAVKEKEQLIRFLIDLHLSDETPSPGLADYILSSFGERFFPDDDMYKLLTDKAHFFRWLKVRLETFLQSLSSHNTASAGCINFSHPDLSMAVYRLIANAEMPRPELPEQLTGIDLAPEDQWVLLLYPPGKNSPSAQGDPEISEQLQKIRNIADVDQESFLMKTRKTMETIVDDLVPPGDREASSYTLFEKLKYLEDRSRLPKTTATFFHTIRKLGNLGAHEAREISLSPSEIEAILSMLSYVMHWHKGNQDSGQ